MPWETAEPTTPLGPREYRSILPFEAAAVSDRLGWVGLEAAKYRDVPDSEVNRPALTYHALILFNRPPEKLELRYEGVNRSRPPPAGSIAIVPAEFPSQWRWAGSKDSLHVFLEQDLVARVASESFDLDPARWALPPLDRLELPQLEAALRTVDAELMAGETGGSLVAESLANILAVHLIRHISGSRRLAHGRDGVLPKGRLRAVVEYIDGHLDHSPSLTDMAAVARLSPYHFSRQFKAATGLPPHQYVIARRVERARGLLQQDEALSLAQVAVRAGFSDQSQLCRHFKRLVGITPGKFRTPAGIEK